MEGWGLEEGREFVEPVNACAEVEGAGEPAEEECGFPRALRLGEPGGAEDCDQRGERDPRGPGVGEGGDGREEEGCGGDAGKSAEDFFEGGHGQVSRGENLTLGAPEGEVGSGALCGCLCSVRGQVVRMRRVVQFFEVSDTVMVWGCHDAGIRTWMHSTALRTERGWWVLDPIYGAGLGWSEVSERIEAGGGVCGYVLTNGNHERDVLAMRAEWVGEVFAHREAVLELGEVVDSILEVGRVLLGGYEVWELFGAGRGEVALVRPGVSAHFGDGLLNLRETGFAFLPDKYCVDAAGLRRSVERLRGCGARLATFAHGDPLWADVGGLVRGLGEE